MQKILKTLGVLATIGILLVVLAGAVVTKTGSGDGCGPNWPLCHGQLFPSEPTIETVIEYTHRLVTGVVGLLILVFTSWAGFKYRKNREVLWMAVASIFFLLLQSMLGALAVVFGQSATVLALHFGFSLLSFVAVFLLATYVFHIDKHGKLPVTNVSTSMKYGSLSLFVYTYIVVYLGALVRHTGSGMGCQGWPLCNGQVIPDFTTGAVAVQFMHRIAALILLIAFGLLFYNAYKQYRSDQRLYILGGSMFALALLQVISGGLIILTGLHIIPSLLHAFLISLLFGLLCYHVLYVYRKTPSSM